MNYLNTPHDVVLVSKVKQLDNMSAPSEETNNDLRHKRGDIRYQLDPF